MIDSLFVYIFLVTGLLPDGSPLWLIPEGLVHEAPTKCILGNGVVVDPKLLLADFANLEKNNIDYTDRLLISQRAHLVTAFHTKITERLKSIREEDGVWLSPTDIAYAYKPLKMGLRMSSLHHPWPLFKETYDRINNTAEKLFRVELSKEEREADLEAFQKLRDIVRSNQMIHDTSLILT